VDEQTLRAFHSADTIQVRSVNSKDFHRDATLPGIVNPRVSFDTCARLNALMTYTKLDIYIHMGESLAKVLQIRPGSDEYIELIVDNNGDTMELVTGCWIPFIMYLRRS
jgi:hypothetical protein